jgi:hypothetical protein
LNNPCESLCLDEITAALRSLGVQEKTWSDYRSKIFSNEFEDTHR